MTWHFPQSGTTGLLLAQGDDVFVAQQVFLNASINAFDTTGHEVIVAGTIACSDNAIIFESFEVEGANSVTVEASGQIRAFDGSGFGIYLFGGRQQVTNHGLIAQQGLHDVTDLAAVWFEPSSSTIEPSSFVNTGIVDADGYGVLNCGQTHNSGTIRGGLGSLVATFSSDQVTNSGRMIGDVLLAAGDDIYDGRLGTIDGDVFGETGNDRLYAGAGNNRLFGQDGNDTLMGGADADYLSGGTGTDRASYASATKAVIVSLANPAINSGEADGDTYNSIENLSGSHYNDYVFGNSAKNAINGGAGNDIIKGYAGNDTLTGYSGADIFVFNTALNASTNVDAVTDFSVAADTIQLDNIVFAALTATGVLASAAFRANATGLAADADDRIIYETDTGNLFYDADGNGAGVGGILFAKLGVGLGLTNADFVVI